MLLRQQPGETDAEKMKLALLQKVLLENQMARIDSAVRALQKEA